MRYEDFIHTVMEIGKLDSFKAAEQIVDACLQTLGQSFYGPERDGLAAQLPDELKASLSKRQFKGHSLEQFYITVGARADVGYPEAVKQVHAVVATLKQAVAPGQLEKVQAVLPAEYRELFDEEPTDPLSPTVEGLSKATDEEKPGTQKLPSEKDLFDLFKVEMEKVMGVLKKLRDTASTEVQQRELLLNEARERILCQIRNEEEQLHPIIEMAPEAESLQASLAEENRRIEHQLKELETLSTEDSRFEYCVESLISEVSIHADREQNELFPKIETIIPGEQAALLAQRIAQETDRLQKEFG